MPCQSSPLLHTRLSRSLAVAPDGRELWAVWRKDGERWYQAKPFASGEFDDIAKKTDEMIRKHSSKNLVNKRAPWRFGPPSDKQIELARREGIYRPGMTKGELSDELNKKWVMQAVARQGARVEQRMALS